MDRQKIDPYFLTDEIEKFLWEKAFFTFDTSTLLNFYFFSQKAQKEIFDTFEKISGRLWIPSYVEFEYLKNRESASKKPIDEKYNKLKQEQLEVIEKSVNDVRKHLKAFQQVVSNDQKHPYLNADVIQGFDEIFKGFEQDFQEFKRNVESDIQRKIAEIETISQDDQVLEAFEEYFSVGREYSYSEILEIVEQGELRYKFRIPPGYLDFEGSNKKDGFQIFGDLIIWKQILEYAEEIKLPTILVINDVKSDWCYPKKRGNETRIDRPREELIKEINDITGANFWMYTLSQFLYKANKLLEANVSQEVIQEISSFIEYEDILTIAIHGDFLLQCNNCDNSFAFPNDQMEPDFQIIDVDERNMGSEIAYEWEEHLNCPICQADVFIICRLWEYPAGVKNYEEVEGKGAKILNSPHLTVNLM